MCVDTFESSGRFDVIVITHPLSGREELEAAVGQPSIRIVWVPGDETRQRSIYNGLEQLAEIGPEIVLIHDAARAWVSQDLINAVFAGAERHGACIPVVPLTDAPKRIGNDGSIAEHMDRSSLANAQTPQGFRFDEILEAHRVARDQGKDYCDDAEAYHKAIGPVFTVAGTPENRKITYEYDLLST